MGLPIKGNWAANHADANNFAGALKWGTGNNPVHSLQIEGPPLRTTGRIPGPEEAHFSAEQVPVDLTDSPFLGYTMEDMVSSGVYEPGYPPVWDEEHPRDNVGSMPAWGTTIPAGGTQFRTLKEGADMHENLVISFPTETVSEGWDNKLTGDINDAEVSSPSQYERQTSMQQVDPPEGRNNSSAQARGTDDARDNIRTRLVGVKVKPWSDSGARREDMFPYQQDLIVRPFHFRTAATDNPDKMAPNAMYVIDPVQRDVPADPYLGPPENAVVATDPYGYVSEDAIPYA